MVEKIHIIGSCLWKVGQGLTGKGNEALFWVMVMFCIWIGGWAMQIYKCVKIQLMYTICEFHCVLILPSKGKKLLNSS